MPATAFKEKQHVGAQFVSREVDRSPEIFADQSCFQRYAEEQVRAFFRRLPSEFVGELRESKFEDKRYGLYAGSNQQHHIGLGFSPDYRLLILSRSPKASIPIRIGDKRAKMLAVDAPTFDLAFIPDTSKSAHIILEAALAQFFLRKGDAGDGALCVRESRNRRTIRKGIDVLRHYLPSGTNIEARCNRLYMNWQASYHL